MSHVRPDGGAPTTGMANPHGRADERPSVFLRNEDDVEHTLDVRIAAGDHLLAETTQRVDGHDQSTIDGDGMWTATAPVRIELWADHGCAASISLDPAAPEAAPPPEFIVRSGSIVVAGVH